MLASFPVSMLNQKPSDLGILNRFKLVPSRSRESPHCTDTEAVLFFRLHFGVLRELEPFASNAKPYFLIEGIYELLG
jgi:hypothetical protein